MAKLSRVWSDWSPIELKKLIEGATPQHEGGSYPQSVLNFFELLGTDTRMREFWEWHNKASGLAKLPKYRGSPWSVCTTAMRARKLPGKPGDMTPIKRGEYFEKVRKHTYALMDLLSGTYFDNYQMTELDDETLDDPLSDHLSDWDGAAHVVAFFVDEVGGRHEMHYDYPDCALGESPQPSVNCAFS